MATNEEIMQGQSEETAAVVSEASAPKKRTRKPWTEEQEKNAAQKRAAAKEKADNLKSGIFVEYGESQVDARALEEAAIAAFRQEKKRARITELNLYIKPEEHAAYYVINGNFNGKVEY